jgi:hypothetical protein
MARLRGFRHTHAERETSAKAAESPSLEADEPALVRDRDGFGAADGV